MSDLSCRTYFCEVRCLATRLSLLQVEYKARILRNTLYQIIHTFLVFYTFLLSWRVSNNLNSSNNTLGLSKQTDLSNKLFTSRQSQFCLNYLYTDFVVLQCKQVSSPAHSHYQIRRCVKNYSLCVLYFRYIIL